MDFNIFYLLIAATVAFSFGCAFGIRIRNVSLQLGGLRIGAVSMTIVGFVATLVFLARDADRGSHGVFVEVVTSVIIAIPFLMLCASSLLAPTRRDEVSVLVLTSVFAIGGASVYYYFFEIREDEYAAVLLFFSVPVEFVIALIQLAAILMNRKRSQNEIRIAEQSDCTECRDDAPVSN